MIRNFLYLDIEKLNSLSSQLFEGVTEYVLNSKSIEDEKSESQKGPVGSGRVIGDILRQSDNTIEKRFLNDFSYNLFEEKLNEDNKIININELSSDVSPQKIKNNSFIKITSTITFNDINHIKSTFLNFNKIGKAFAHATNYKAIQSIKEMIRSLEINGHSNKSKINELKREINIEKIARENNLQHDQDFLNDLNTLFEYGYQDQFEVQMNIHNLTISANLKRDYLRDNEQMIVRKYSRHTEVEFTLFGIITQSTGANTSTPDVELEYDDLKTALKYLIGILTNLESSFTGKLANEIIIDPIAIYSEI